MSFSSVELNYLILRYLEECGMSHAAYVFGRESHVLEAEVDARDVPNGALVNIVQKGIYFTEYEVTVSNQDGTCAESESATLSLIEAVGNEDILRQRVRERREAASTSTGSRGIKTGSPVEDAPGSSAGASSSSSQRERDREARAERVNGGLNGGGGAMHVPPQRRDRHNAAALATSASSSAASPHLARPPDGMAGGGLGGTPGGGGGGGTPGMPPQHQQQQHHQHPINGLYHKKHAAAAASAANGLIRVNGSEYGIGGNGSTNGDAWKSSIEIDKSKVHLMTKHTSEVFICSWNPQRDYICTGSGDSTARIWDVASSCEPSTTAASLEHRSVALKHCLSSSIAGGQTGQGNKDVTSIDWSPHGEFLATGCYDGMARIWTPEGNLMNTLSSHKGPIFALKWNETGNYILTAGVDKSTIIWDPLQNKIVQQFNFHTQSAIDVDWLSLDAFASCSTDRRIHVCRLGCDKPLRSYEGHTNEVNAIRYDRFSQRLASCSDDRTLKIWSLTQDRPLMDVSAHTKEIYTIRWSPTGFYLASASFDHSVRIWDVQKETCLLQLDKHTEPVYSVAFSPDGRYVASGSFDRCIYVWDVKSGEVVLSYTGPVKKDGGIFEVNWNHSGEKLAGCTNDGSLVVLDIRQLSVKKPQFRPLGEPFLG